MTKWWQIDIPEIEKSLNTNLSAGLSSNEAKNRLAKYGANQLKEKKGCSPLSIFLEQFRDFIVWILIGAALVSGFLKEWVDAFAIIAIVILNAILGFIQEYRAEKSLAALKKLASPISKVIRDGQHNNIASRELVPGDLIELEAGDNIPADSRIIWRTSNFSVQEASLTGESTPVMKTSFALEEKDIPLADRANMLYLGTTVASGKTKAVVCETGMNTELGKIAGMIQEIEQEATPLQKKLEQFGKWIVILCFILVGLVFVLGLLRSGKVVDLFLTAVSLAVAAIPEGLPAVVTVALALGVRTAGCEDRGNGEHCDRQRECPCVADFQTHSASPAGWTCRPAYDVAGAQCSVNQAAGPQCARHGGRSAQFSTVMIPVNSSGIRR